MDAASTIPPASSLDSAAPPPSPPAGSAGPEASPNRRAAALTWLVLTGAALAACWGVFVALDRIDNNPANFTLYSSRLYTLAVVCDVIALAACAACWTAASNAVPRAARFAVIIVVATYVLWNAPVFFGVHRYLLALLGLVAAARLALAPLLALRERPAPRARWWSMPVLIAGGLALAAEVMISMKLSALGWAFAID